MIVETLQLLSIVIYHNIHLLFFFFMFFTLTSHVLIKYHSRKYRSYQSDRKRKVTVVVPVYAENHELFEKCLKSIADQNPDQLIVCLDGKDGRLAAIASTYAELYRSETRRGKRQALVEGCRRARNEIVVNIDSDVILEPACLDEITKPFDDPEIVAVSAWHTSTPSSSGISSAMSRLIEANRIVNDMGLNEGLVVVDGRCAAWRREFLLSVSDEFLNERWLGVRGMIGDDRFLSRQALKKGFKTVIQSTAKILTRAPDSFSEFLKQQIRWRRSGTKFFLKDLYENVSPSFTYRYKCFTYYTRSYVLAAVIILDWFFFRLPFYWWAWAWWQALIIAIIGATMVTALLQTIYHGKPLEILWLPVQAILSLFVMLPLNIYAGLTAWRQDNWMSRGDSNGISISSVVLFAISLMISLASVFPFFVVESIVYE